jgi:enoyl-CoA hydratase/carnithine racemase
VETHADSPGGEIRSQVGDRDDQRPLVTLTATMPTAAMAPRSCCHRVAHRPNWLSVMFGGAIPLAPRSVLAQNPLTITPEVPMSKFDDYANKYKTIRMERRNGILQMTLHTDGGSLRWGFLPHGELPDAFYDVGADRENRVVIITGTGAEFSGPRANPGTSSFPTRPSIERIDRIHWEGRHLLMKLLEIEVPVISAVNGPAWRHSEIPLLCDIVLAADTAQFQDSAHFPSDVVPGDGMHIVYPLLLGMNRGRYFLLTGQTLNAQKALELGLVAEVHPPDKLLGRAWELAEDLARRPTLLLRYTRLLLTEALRRHMHDLLGYGLGMELLALGEKPEG